MHVDQRLLRRRHLQQRVARRRHLAQPLADHQQHVGVAHARRELRVDADADVAGVVADGGCRTGPGCGTRRRPAARAPRRSARSAAQASRSQRLPPTSTSGRSPRREPRAAAATSRAVRRGRDRLDARRVGARRARGQHVLGQRQHDRAGPAGHRDAIRVRDVLGDAFRRARSARPIWRCCRTSAGSRSPGTPRGRRSRRRPGRRTRSSASNPAPPCGCRWPRSTRRARASRRRCPGGR